MIDDAQLAEQLLHLELLNEERLQQGRQHQNLTGSPLYEVLIQEDIVSEDLLVDVAADILNIPSVHLASYEFVPEIVGLISSTMAHRTKALPLAENGGLLLLAMADPLDIMAMDEIATHTSIDIQPVLVGPNDLLRALERAYHGQAAGLSKPGRQSDPTIDLMQMSSGSAALGDQDSWGAFFDDANLHDPVESEELSQEMRDRPSSLEFSLDEDSDEESSEPIIDLGGWEIDANQGENYIEGEPRAEVDASGEANYANVGSHYVEEDEESEAIPLVDEIPQNDDDFFESIFSELADPEESFEAPAAPASPFQLSPAAPAEPPPGSGKSLDALRSLRAKLNKNRQEEPEDAPQDAPEDVSVEPQEPAPKKEPEDAPQDAHEAPSETKEEPPMLFSELFEDSEAPEPPKPAPKPAPKSTPALPPPLPADASSNPLGRVAVKRITIKKSSPPPIIERNSHLEKQKILPPPEPFVDEKEDEPLTVEAPEYVLHELATRAYDELDPEDLGPAEDSDASEAPDQEPEASPEPEDDGIILDESLEEDSPSEDAPFVLESFLSQDPSDALEVGQPPASFLDPPSEESSVTSEIDPLQDLIDTPLPGLSEKTATVDEQMQQHVEEIRGMMRSTSMDEHVDRELYNRVTTMNQALTMDRLRDMRREQSKRAKSTPLDVMIEQGAALREMLPATLSDQSLLHAALAIVLTRKLATRDELIAVAQSFEAGDEEE